MSAMARKKKGVAMPKLSAAKAVGPLSIRVKWKSGARAGRSETIDLSPLINCFKFYRPLRGDPKKFRSVDLIDDGEALAWDGGQIDMASTSIERLAEEAMTSADFKRFMKSHELTQEGAAALLGRSRRQVVNYSRGTRIPRLVALACLSLNSRELSA